MFDDVRQSLPDHELLHAVSSQKLTSRIDYCSSLNAGMSAANFKKLQWVQNTLVRVVHQLSCHDHITPARVQLHWLPVRHRITFKIATITFNLLKFRRPSYLCQFAQSYTPSRDLRLLKWLNQNMLVVNRTHFAFAERSFGHTSATDWNNLPAKCRNCLGLTVETFRKHLET